MPLTLLLDLDDTLLVNNMHDFIPAYLRELSNHLIDFAEPKILIDTLLSATNQMIDNDHPGMTLKDVFDCNFYPALGVQEDQINLAIEQFYLKVFPNLQYLTNPVSGAVELIEEAINRDYQILIATNPLFPLQAIVHRLNWAGLSPDRYQFKFIPSYDTFHFAKPNPAYFLELLTRIDFEESPVLMVGDDLKLDIDAAKQAGIYTYHVSKSEDNTSQTDACGSLSNLIPWIDKHEITEFIPSFSKPTAISAWLRAIPASLRVICNQLEYERWSIRPSPSEWSQTEILCHLRDVEIEVNLPRIFTILQDENPFIPAKDTDQWAEARNYNLQNGHDALKKYIDARYKLLVELNKYPFESWTRKAKHGIFGPTTLHEMIRIISAHDDLHLHQIIKTQKAMLA